MAARVPTLRKRVVYHVGDLGLDDDGTVLPVTGRRGRESQEFTGLSVSEYPEEWTRIARLGGFATFALTRADGKPGVFVDMLSFDAKPLIAEAASRGWLVPQTWWETSWEEEVGWDETQTYAMMFKTEAEALAEAEEREGQEPEVVSREVWTATPRLQALYGRSFSGDLGTKGAEFAVLVLLEEMGKYDGAWWAEDLRPELLSAPRGSIFQSRLPLWRAIPTASGA